VGTSCFVDLWEEDSHLFIDEEFGEDDISCFLTVEELDDETSHFLTLPPVGSATLGEADWTLCWFQNPIRLDSPPLDILSESAYIYNLVKEDSTFGRFTPLTRVYELGSTPGLSTVMFSHPRVRI